MWKRTIAIVAVLLAAGAAGGLLVAWSGLYDIGARRGHFEITRRILAFAMRNSVETHARAITAPPLDDPALILLGLRHYDGGCTPCHGAPGHPRNPIPMRLVPMPPHLPAVVREWTPAQLFWIVRNGLKYTGMPAWPADGRDDEVWAVVAALRQLPALDAVAYRRLARGPLAADDARTTGDAARLALVGPFGEDLIACARCHGLRGEGGGPFPRLAGLDADYLHDALRRFASGARPSGIMQPVAVELSDVEMRELARYFAQIPAPRPPPAAAADAGALHARGASIARTGNPARGVPPCAPCHGPTDAPRHPLYPPIAGQPAAYLRQQLHLWRAGTPAATPQGAVMHAAARQLRDDEIAAVADYYAQLAPESGAAAAPPAEEP